MEEPAEFRQNLLEAVDHGLMVLGERVRQAIYDRIERTHGLKREEIPERLGVFHDALTSALGVGARSVERLIAKSLCQRLSLNFTPRENWSIVDYVKYAKKARGLG